MLIMPSSRHIRVTPSHTTTEQEIQESMSPIVLCSFECSREQTRMLSPWSFLPPNGPHRITNRERKGWESASPSAASQQQHFHSQSVSDSHRLLVESSRRGWFSFSRDTRRTSLLSKNGIRLVFTVIRGKEACEINCKVLCESVLGYVVVSLCTVLKPRGPNANLDECAI